MHVILMNKIEVIHQQKNIFGNINCSEYNGMYLLVTVFVSAAVNTLKQTENRELKQVHKISRSMFESCLLPINFMPCFQFILGGGGVFSLLCARSMFNQAILWLFSRFAFGVHQHREQGAFNFLH